MALLYPWATKEYLLWEMTIGQIVAYHNIGIEIKYPNPGKPDPDKRSLKNMSRKEVGKAQQEARDTVKEIRSKENKEQYRAKYGDI